MNKIVHIHYYEPIKEDSLYKSYFSNRIIPLFSVDTYMSEVYGLHCIHIFDYEVTDEAKFTLFILKYPECINRIWT